MKYVKTETRKHYRVNLDLVHYYYPNDYNGSYFIKFKYPGNDSSWTFKDQAERDQALEQLDAASTAQNVQTIVSL